MINNWRPIPDFPDYMVNPEGYIINAKTELIKKHSYNQHGIANVILMQDGESYRRSVAVIVAEAYLAPPARNTFNTPIHLNGDRSDCRADNLAWRPRWFAVSYHKQFDPDYIPALNRPVYDKETGVEYENSLHAAIANGVLDREVLLSVLNHTPTFPTFQQFLMAEDS